jgi:hypothetical protein
MMDNIQRTEIRIPQEGIISSAVVIEEVELQTQERFRGKMENKETISGKILIFFPEWK